MQTIHEDQPIMSTGTPLDEAKAVMIAVHGRGASAQSILGLSQNFAQPEFAYLAPQARGNTWYPHSFLAPTEQNEPFLSSALSALDRVVSHVTVNGFSHEQIVLLGFSQGACLATEYAARNATRFGGVVALSGGLIGAPGTSRDYDGSMDGTPVFLGCSDTDFHIPLDRVNESADVFERMGASVNKRIYPGMGHTINEDELHAVKQIMATLLE